MPISCFDKFKEAVEEYNNAINEKDMIINDIEKIQRMLDYLNQKIWQSNGYT